RPVNVTVTQLKANSATVSWDVPEGDVIIGYTIVQQRQDGQMQRFIREVNTTNRACVLWDLAEDADYIIQVQSIGLYGESQASKRVHFRTLKETDRLPSNSSSQGDITVEGLDKDRQLRTGEIVIIAVVLLMWAEVIALFCRQYDIIKDNDSNNTKEKSKPSSEPSTPERPAGGLLRSKVRRGHGNGTKIPRFSRGNLNSTTTLAICTNYANNFPAFCSLNFGPLLSLAGERSVVLAGLKGPPRGPDPAPQSGNWPCHDCSRVKFTGSAACDRCARGTLQASQSGSGVCAVGGLLKAAQTVCGGGGLFQAAQCVYVCRWDATGSTVCVRCACTG
uniref:Fibronectin type III domain containing 4 n=1 Tax=Sphenodon punctatus TaxID=8508 RepID=A0A8D0GCF0_SPHPU